MTAREVTILIADDDEGHLRLVERNLRRGALHNPIMRFKDGQEVLDFLVAPENDLPGSERPYLLLLDIRMPKLDGIEVLTRIKGNPNLRSLPVIMLTTTDDPADIERCYALGCNSYIVKPVCESAG